jgi:hypothetical protein
MRASALFEVVYDKLSGDKRLRFFERLQLAKARSANERWRGNMLLVSNDAKRARGSYWRALITYPSLRSITRYLISFLPRQISARTIGARATKFC